MNKKIKIVWLSLIFLLSGTFFTPQKTQAYAAWPDLGGAFFETMLENAWSQMQAALVGALKKAAIDTITETVNNLVAGTSQASSLFISDWSDYLFGTPRGNANKYMNDFFTITTRGRTNGGYNNTLCGTNYAEWRSERAKQVNAVVDLTELQSDFEEFACSPVEMFADGTWAGYNAFMKPNNNPILYNLIAQSEYEEILKKEEGAALAQAIAYQGFVAKKNEDSENVITPGSTIKDLLTSANTLDNLTIANAKNVGEVAGIVVGKVASNVIKQGIGNARLQVQNKINDGICEGSQELRDQLREFTPSGNLMSGFGMGSLGSGKSTGTCNLR